MHEVPRFQDTTEDQFDVESIEAAGGATAGEEAEVVVAADAAL